MSVFSTIQAVSRKRTKVTKPELLRIARKVLYLYPGREEQRHKGMLITSLNKQRAYIMPLLENEEVKYKIREICGTVPLPPSSGDPAGEEFDEDNNAQDQNPQHPAQIPDEWSFDFFFDFKDDFDHMDVPDFSWS